MSISPKKGFTLIELMVAIAIIAILATVGMVVYSTAQKSGRISKRIQDLEALKTALEVYKTSTGSYPSIGSAEWPGYQNCISAYLGVLVPNYMPVLPADPLDNGNAGGANCYHYTANATVNPSEYKIRTTVGWVTSGEMNSAAFAQQPTLLDPAQDGEGTANCTFAASPIYRGWAVYSGGATTCAY